MLWLVVVLWCVVALVSVSFWPAAGGVTILDDAPEVRGTWNRTFKADSCFPMTQL
jgi:hypothetical protein